jgi:intracellular septation protein A
MSSYALIAGLLPLVIFVIIDAFAGVKLAAMSALLLAIGEAIFTFFWIGEIDIVTGSGLILIAIMALMTIKKESPLFIKLQPVIFGIILGLALVISYAMDRPLLLELMVKYKDFLPDQVKPFINNPLYIELIKMGTLTSGVGLILHALLTCYAAFRMSNWWWIFIRGIGVYIFLILSSFFAKVLI